MEVVIIEKGFIILLAIFTAVTGTTSLALMNYEDIEIYQVNENLYQGQIITASDNIVFTAEKANIHIDDIKEYLEKNNEEVKEKSAKKDKPGKIKFTFWSKNGETKVEYEHENIEDFEFDKQFIEEIFKKMEFNQEEIKKKQAKNSLWNRFIDFIEKD